MVMGFQDEIDDEDYLRPSEFGNPVMQISDSSDDELRPPVRHKKESSVFKASRALENVAIKDDLDDWLNGEDETLPATKFKAPSPATSRDYEIPISRKIPEQKTEVIALEESSIESTGKGKRTKEKKGKRKSKRSSMEDRTSSDPVQDTNTVGESRVYNDYEEL